MKENFYNPKDYMFTEKKPYKATIRFIPATKEELEQYKIKHTKIKLRQNRLDKLNKLEL